MRLFSVPRRRLHLVDVMIPFTYGVDLYRLKWGANFDTAVFTSIIDSTNVGFIDPAVSRYSVETQPTQGRTVRVVFDPTTYSIPDSTPFWLKFVPVTGGIEGVSSPATLILTDDAHHGVGIVTLQGTAPSGLGVANSLQIDLPRLMQDVRITNQDTLKVLYVATEPGGSEMAVYPSTTVGLTPLSLQATQASLLVRGGSGTVAFSATCTLAFPR